MVSRQEAEFKRPAMKAPDPTGREMIRQNGAPVRTTIDEVSGVIRNILAR